MLETAPSYLEKGGYKNFRELSSYKIAKIKETDPQRGAELEKTFVEIGKQVEESVHGLVKL